MFREGYISVCIFKNVFDHRTIYDIVLYRKIKDKQGKSTYQRGANLKPSDLAAVIRLMQDAETYLTSV